MLLKLRSFNELKSKKHFRTKRTCCLKFHHSPAMLKCFQKLSFQGFPERETDRQTDRHAYRPSERQTGTERGTEKDRDRLVDYMAFKAIFNAISVISRLLVYLSMHSWNSFDQYSAKYFFQATGCFPTQPSWKKMDNS